MPYMNKFTWGFELKFVWFVSAGLCWGERGKELLKIKMPVHWTKMTREKQILLFSIERNGETSWTCMFLLIFAFVPAPTIITILFDARDSIRMNVSAYTLFCECFLFCLVEYVIVAQCITLAISSKPSRLCSTCDSSRLLSMWYSEFRSSHFAAFISSLVGMAWHGMARVRVYSLPV